MRHSKKFNHLGRTSAHRKAMLSNMANSLIFHKRIATTVAKAKALRVYVEPLITKAKDDATHSRRIVFEYLKSKTAVSMLFRDIAEKVGDRPGGYTRILKTGNRLGDNAEMCIIELVDFNESMLAAKESKAKPAKSRRGGKKKADAPKATAPVEPVATPAAPEVEVMEAPEEKTEE
jgi:large subunit ribosomal protein L17